MGIRILIADDHVVVREGICRVLQEQSDLEIIGEAGDGEAVVRMSAEMHPDIVIMDIDMPRLSGIEATRQIKRNQPEVPVMILSAYDEDEYFMELLKIGANGYLLKTINSNELVRAVRAICNNEMVLDPTITRKLVERLTVLSSSAEERKTANDLTGREIDIIKLVARGMSNKCIASKLELSDRTVEGHLRTIFDKLGVSSRTEAVLCALKRGWVILEDSVT